MQAEIKTDDIGFLTYWSPEAKELFGFENYEVEGWYLAVFIHSIEKMEDEKRRKLGLEKILRDVVDKGNTFSFSTINIRADLRAFFNSVEITPDEEGTKATISKGDDSVDIMEYNAMIKSLDDRPTVVTNKKGKILGVNGEFAIMSKFNRMRLLNRPLGISEEAEIFDLGELFGSLDGYILAWPEQEKK